VPKQRFIGTGHIVGGGISLFGTIRMWVARAMNVPDRGHQFVPIDECCRQLALEDALEEFGMDRPPIVYSCGSA